MPTTTTKLGLIKPDYTDNVDVADLNSNADDIDAAVGFVICTSTTRPSTPWTGQSIFETDTGDSFVWDGNSWEPAGGGGSIEISATAPSNPGEGDLWWDSDNGNLYIYYNDGNSSQWVAANGPQVFVGTTAPAGYQGQLWFDSTQGKTYIYYDDGTSAQWVSAIGGSLAGNVIQVVSTTLTDTFTTTTGTSASPVDITGLSLTITPKSASSKIMLFCDIGIFGASADTQAGAFFARNGTAIGRATAGTQNGASNVWNGTTIASNMPISFSYLDSPGTTSAITYNVKCFRNTGTLHVNRWTIDTTNRGVSTITAMEIAG